MNGIKLYCYKLQDGDKITDVHHMLAKDAKEVHVRLDKTIQQCIECGLKEYNSYSFFEVSEVDGFSIKINDGESVS